MCVRAFTFLFSVMARCATIGFDEYYKSLRPRLTPQDCTQSALVNRPHPQNPKLQINCRNIWFNEFWSQHHKCSFDGASTDDRLPRCTGNETLTNYEQEGLVPFVGKYLDKLTISLKKPSILFLNRFCVCQIDSFQHVNCMF